MAKGFMNRESKKVFKIVAIIDGPPDKATGQPTKLVRLKGDFTIFTEKLDKERFKALGYELVDIEEEAA